MLRYGRGVLHSIKTQNKRSGRSARVVYRRTFQMTPLYCYVVSMESSKKIEIFCLELQKWFAIHKRTLPWRDLKEKNIDHKAYLVLVSEIMLQQTQVPRVIILYKNFIQIFPRIEDLAKASNKQVLLAWRGLGYNNRALRLRDAVREIVEKFHGKFPREMNDLLSLPGIGHYTAAAIRNFAFGLSTPCLDTNIRRILHRFFVGPENADGTWKKDDKFLLKLAEKVLGVAMKTNNKKVREAAGLAGPAAGAPPLREKMVHGRKTVGLPSMNFHAALMDFGSLVCTKNNPKWELFPLGMRSICKAYRKVKVRTKKVNKKLEIGREVAGKHIPNRIFRGRIIEALRDAPRGLSLHQIGSQVTIDWPEALSEVEGTMDDHREWLMGLLVALKRDGLIERRGVRWKLKE